MVVKMERTGWRDGQISERHRMWGEDCPAVDMDFVLNEFDRGKAAAIVEYKHELAMPIRLCHPSMRALADLGDRAVVPFFVTRYSYDFAKWYATPANDKAKEFLPSPISMSEEEWVRFLYHLRGREMPANCFSCC